MLPQFGGPKMAIYNQSGLTQGWKLTLAHLLTCPGECQNYNYLGKCLLQLINIIQGGLL